MEAKKDMEEACSGRKCERKMHFDDDNMLKTIWRIRSLLPVGDTTRFKTLVSLC